MENCLKLGINNHGILWVSRRKIQISMKMLLRAYNLIMNKITRSLDIVKY